MKITPLEIYQKEFRRKAWNGLDPEDVEEFLYRVAEGVEALLHENAEWRRRLGLADGDANRGAQPEDGEGRTVVASAAEELEQAQREARRVLAAAEAEARAIRERAQIEAERIFTIARRNRVDRREEDNRARRMADAYHRLLQAHLLQLSALIEESSSRAEPDAGHAEDEDTTTSSRMPQV